MSNAALAKIAGGFICLGFSKYRDTVQKLHFKNCVIAKVNFPYTVDSMYKVVVN